MAANVFDASGLSLATRDYWIDFFSTKFQEIYGPDVNLSSDTPDGQLIGIITQVILDLQDLIAAVNAGFDPDQAIGVVLDQRVAINGIQRLGGTFTVTPITVVTDRSLTLYGLDQTTQPVFTVSDNEGNRWLLQTTSAVLAGTHILSFRAENPGAELTTPNTITVPVTIVLGVVSVNNPSPYTTLGINQETDAQLRVRRQKSVSLASQGYLNGLLAALLNINGVTDAFIYENKTNAVDSDGVPGHSIWVIVGGSAPDAEIADAIYRKRNAGCGMFGAQSFIITQADGTSFIINWDAVVTRTVYCRFTVTSIDGIVSPDYAAIRAGLPDAYRVGVFEPLNATALGAAVQTIDSNTLVTQAGFSLATLQGVNFSGPVSSGVFKLVYAGNASADINWNDSAATVQSKIQAIPGLAAATSTFRPLDGFILVNFDNVSDVVSVLSAIDNTLNGGFGPVDISIGLTFDQILNSPTKKNQLLLSSENVIILPLLPTPAAFLELQSAETVTLSALGGYGGYSFSLIVDNSGATVDATSGLYTAGGGTGTDTVQIKDGLGNSVNVNIVVT